MQLGHPLLPLPLAAGHLLALEGQRIQLGAVGGELDAQLPGRLGDQRDRFLDGEGGPLEVDVGEREAAGRVMDAVEHELGQERALAHPAGTVDDQRGHRRRVVRTAVRPGSGSRGPAGRSDIVPQLREFARAPLERAAQEALQGVEQPGPLQGVLKLRGVRQPGHARHPGEPQHRLEGVGQFVGGQPVRRRGAAGQIGQTEALRAGFGGETGMALQDAPGGLGSGQPAQCPLPDIVLEGPLGLVLCPHGRAVVDQFQYRAAGPLPFPGQPEPQRIETAQETGRFPVGPAGGGDLLPAVLARVQLRP